MKKLLMFAAVAAMGVSAFASPCVDAGPEESVACYTAYDFKASLKTTKAKAATIKIECEDDEAVCYREKASMSIKGYYYACDCDCDFKEGYDLVFWDNKNKEIVAILYQKGIFNLKDSVITIANHLGISKNTAYMHIRNMNK